MVIGSALYRVSLRVRRLDTAAWTAICAACAGRIGSLLELRQGWLSEDVAEVFTHRDRGMFPQPGEIVASCECGDTTTLCKHAAAVLSGIGSRLDESPERLFLLRGVDETELIADEGARSRDPVVNGGVEPVVANGTAANAAESRPLNVPGAAASKALPVSPPTSTDSATASRPVRKTLTYRPPVPTAAARQATRPTRRPDSCPRARWSPTCARSAAARSPSSRI